MVANGLCKDLEKAKNVCYWFMRGLITKCLLTVQARTRQKTLLIVHVTTASSRKYLQMCRIRAHCLPSPTFLKLATFLGVRMGGLHPVIEYLWFHIGRGFCPWWRLMLNPGVNVDDWYCHVGLSSLFKFGLECFDCRLRFLMLIYARHSWVSADSGHIMFEVILSVL